MFTGRITSELKAKAIEIDEATAIEVIKTYTTEKPK